MTQTTTKERPIIFGAESVRTILDGRKTQTRRVIKPDWFRCLDPDDSEDLERARLDCPYGQPGDRLWARETAWYDKEAVLPTGYRAFFGDGRLKMQRDGHYGWATGGKEMARAIVGRQNCPGGDRCRRPHAHDIAGAPHGRAAEREGGAA